MSGDFLMSRRVFAGGALLPPLTAGDGDYMLPASFDISGR